MGKVTGGKKMEYLLRSGKLPYRGGQCIDLFNMSVQDGVAYTIRTTIDTSNMIFITVEK